MTPKPIGVFDSGIGGEAMASAIRRVFPDREIVAVNDAEHLPYGTKQPAELLGYVIPKLQDLVDRGCEVIVIACNTVTTTLISELRQQINVPLVGMEPMVKPAAQLSKSKIVAVCATPVTLASARYAWLKSEFAGPKNVRVVEPDCSTWASMIESNNVNQQTIRNVVDSVCEAGADVIVLGCTHYHWIEDEIKAMAAGRAVVLQPEAPVIEQLKRVLAQLV